MPGVLQTYGLSRKLHWRVVATPLSRRLVVMAQWRPGDVHAVGVEKPVQGFYLATRVSLAGHLLGGWEVGKRSGNLAKEVLHLAGRLIDVDDSRRLAVG